MTLKKFAMLTGVALFATTPILFADAAQAQSRCRPGENYCRPGPWGPGGCYSVLRINTCKNGMICTDSMIHCPPGSKGPGGCYRVGIRHCDKGQIRP